MLGNRLAVVRAATVALAAAVVGSVAFAAPASADVTLTPDQATQDDAARLAFRVTSESGSAPTTKVQVALPETTPIAEVYPLSNPDWAPALTQRTLDKPIQAIHGTETTRVVTMITWTARPGWQLQPGTSAVLNLELGPLPETDQVAFTVTETHADGSVTTPPQLVLNLAPPPAGQAQAQGHDAHSGTASGTGDETARASGDGSGSGGGTKLALIISVLVIGLLGGAVVGGVALPRLRRGAAALKVSPDALNTPADPHPVDHEVGSDKSDISRR
jgi:periplasmic copper chaperone A